jgi:SAM-dependent methyltransferase
MLNCYMRDNVSVNGVELVPSTTNIVVACFPKAGSTYVSMLLSEITGFPHMPAVQFYGQNEQDLFEPALQRFPLTNSVTQQHVKGTRTNIQLMKNYHIRPVILVRNIFDVVLSLHDHFVREDTLTPVGYVHQEYHTMSVEERMWFLINLHLPWYFHFFVSWQEATRELDVLWLTYEEFFAHPVMTTQRILQFYGLPASADAIQQAMVRIKEKNTRQNVGVAGRGASLPDVHRQAILRLAQAWQIDAARLHLIGLAAQNNYHVEQTQRDLEAQLPRRQTPVYLDLGCGAVKQASFIGLDRYPLPGVDIIADLDRPLPFCDDSVDLVYASHSLEHVTDLLVAIKEIYRVCRHGAQVCIVAPYYQQSLNLANPYHKQVFNEHTPRFWTNAPAAPLPTAEFAHPHAVTWGLSESDSRIADLDLRCLRMEFFYFPAYRNLPAEEQRAARQKYLDVCDQIMFHLLVVKSPIDDNEVRQIAEQMHYYDPPFTQIRRLRETLEQQEQRVSTLQQTVATQDAELTRVRAELATFHQELQHTQKEKEEQAAAHTTTMQALAARDAELAGVRTELVTLHQEVQQIKEEREKQDAAQATRLQDLRAELSQSQRAAQELQDTLRQTTAVRDAEAQQARAQYASLQQQLARFDHHKQNALTELRALRRHHETRRWARFHRGGDLRNEIAPAFQQLKDDSLLFTRSLRGFRLQTSPDLCSVPFLAYPLELELHRPGLSGLLLAPILDFPAQDGRFGIEIVSPANTIVAQIAMPCSEIDVRVPTTFRFAPIADSHQGRFWLRVFVRDVTEPLRIFEWRKYRFAGFGPLQTRAFCGFLFTE